MQINELAEILAVSASTLRHWEKTLELDVPRDELGQRTYPPEWVEYFRQVKALLDAGKKYEQIKQELTPPQSQTPAEPPVPVTPPAELEEMKAAIARRSFFGTKAPMGCRWEAQTRCPLRRPGSNRAADHLWAEVSKVEGGVRPATTIHRE